MPDIEMRTVFAGQLDALMAQDKSIVVLSADLAKSNGVSGLKDKYPTRCFEMGVAEANMASVAAGMASYGLKPVIGSFTPFATRRICDQLAISISYAKSNVKILGSDPGITAELNGGTHMSVEDIGVLRSIPDIVIFEPVDTVQLAAAMPVIMQYNGPLYIRLFRKKIADVFDANYKFDLYKADVVREGKDVTILASGIMVQESLAALEMLNAKGISAHIVNVHTIKPIDKETVLSSLQKTGCAVVAENHNIIGGLYSAVCETLAGQFKCPIIPVGINDSFGEVGRLPYLKERFNLRAVDIVNAAQKAIEQK